MIDWTKIKPKVKNVEYESREDTLHKKLCDYAEARPLLLVDVLIKARYDDILLFRRWTGEHTWYDEKIVSPNEESDYPAWDMIVAYPELLNEKVEFISTYRGERGLFLAIRLFPTKTTEAEVKRIAEENQDKPSGLLRWPHD